MGVIKKSTAYHAQALSRGLNILTYLASSPNKSESLVNLNDFTKLPKSTLIRLLTVLENNRFVTKIDDSNRYRLGSAVVDLAASYDRNSSIRELTTPFLRSLATGIGHTVELGVLENYKLTLINVQQSDRNLRFHSKIGSSWPINCTSLGKILLAGLNDNKAYELLMNSAPFEQRTNSTLIAPEEIMADVARSKIRGYAISQEEHNEGVCALGVPIRNNDTVLNWKTAISITGPVGEMTGSKKSVLVNQLKETASRMYEDKELQAVFLIK